MQNKQENFNQGSKEYDYRIICGIPCLNTETSIGRIVTEAKEYVSQVVVINDGSIDKTESIAQEAGAIVINHNYNKGAGRAAQTCFDMAKQMNAKILITIDGDAQHNPNEIPKIIAPIIRGEADVVIGSRFMENKTNMPYYRRLGIWIINNLFNFGSRQKISDTQCCFRAFGEKALNALSISASGFSFSIEILQKAREKHLTIVEVPVSCIYDTNSHSLNPIIHGIGVAFSVVKYRLRSLLPGRNN